MIANNHLRTFNVHVWCEQGVRLPASMWIRVSPEHATWCMLNRPEYKIKLDTRTGTHWLMTLDFNRCNRRMRATPPLGFEAGGIFGDNVPHDLGDQDHFERPLELVETPSVGRLAISDDYQPFYDTAVEESSVDVCSIEDDQER